MHQVFDREGVEIGFRCSTPGCKNVAIHYDVKTARMRCAQCQQQSWITRVLSLLFNRNR